MENEIGASMEMPRWKCHKEVWALKISGIGPLDDEGFAELFFEDKRYAPIKVGYDYRSRNQPVVGGYYVVYKDGYKSFSPADAFEDGYTLVHSVGADTLDVEPHGQGCYSGFAVSTPDHAFFLSTEAAGFTYKICGRCGTVRISEKHS